MRDPIRHKCGGGVAGPGPYCFSLSLEMPSYGCPSAKHYLTNFSAFFAFGAVSVIRPVETLGTTFRMVATDGDAKKCPEPDAVR